MGYVRGDPPGPGDARPQGTVYPLSGPGGNRYEAIPARGTGGTRITARGFLAQHFGKIIAAVVIALLTGSTAPWWWPWGSSTRPASGRPQDSVTIAALDPGGNGGVGAGSVQATGTSHDGGAATSQSAVDGCTIVISNPFATIAETPEPVNPGGTKIPPGSYSVLATTHTSFAGQSLLWFKITASGRTGWIRDDTILIDSKSAQCP